MTTAKDILVHGFQSNVQENSTNSCLDVCDNKLEAHNDDDMDDGSGDRRREGGGGEKEHAPGVMQWVRKISKRKQEITTSVFA